MASNINPALFLDPVMTIICVGERKFSVHKALACAKLGYFKAAYNANMREAHENEFHLVDVDEVGFEVLVAWLYTGNVCLKGGEVFKRETLHGRSMDLEANWQAEEEPIDDVEEDESDMVMDYRRVGRRDVHLNYDVDTQDKEMFEEEEEEDEEEDDDADDDEEEEKAEEEENDDDQGESNGRTFEETLIWSIWPGTKPAEFDAFQLRRLLQLNDSHTLGSSLDNKQRKMLKQKEEEEEEAVGKDEEPEEEGQDSAAYDALIEQYIVADRFDAPELRNQLIDLLRTEHHYQRSLIGG